ncbi:MAG: DNA cytosine methyltransferase [Oscillatoria sp. PMC 1068.18]|nr:DNA cytosine methyltransferase [Oscillatoria sp. PMC 1076.18]MEC4988579.1 DNA cytosine methyltransferase [Oscillatoria sp. PMC 1068.18]
MRRKIIKIDSEKEKKPSSRRPIAVDLFAGAGGFSLGIEQAGFEVAVAVESDPVHAAVYSYNFPQTQVLCRDVASLDAREIIQAVGGEIDLVFGGPPCQGFSSMGKRNPKDDRNSLVFAFCRLVKELQPRYFVIENVPGLNQGKHRQILRRLKHDLKDAGYKIREPVQILNAADFGVPQKRKRLFLLGWRYKENALFYPETEPKERVSVRDAIADLPNLDDLPQLLHTDEIEFRYKRNLSNYVKILRELIPDPDNFAHRRIWKRSLLTSSRRTQHQTQSRERFHLTQPGELEPISRLRKLDWNKCSHTLRAGTGIERGSFTSARPLHPEGDRVISVREAARLHSFPDWFRLHATKWHGFRQVGNAVPPLLARALGAKIIIALGIVPVVPKKKIALGELSLLRWNQKQAWSYWEKLSSGS